MWPNLNEPGGLSGSFQKIIIINISLVAQKQAVEKIVAAASDQRNTSSLTLFRVMQ